MLLSSADGYTLKRTEPDAESLHLISCSRGDWRISTMTAREARCRSRYGLSTAWLALRRGSNRRAAHGLAAAHRRPSAPAMKSHGGKSSRRAVPVNMKSGVRRTTPDRPLERDIDEIYWATLRSFEASAAINFDQPLARTALRIRATDQLHASVISSTESARHRFSIGTVPPGWSAKHRTTRRSIATSYRARPDPTPSLIRESTFRAIETWHDFCRINELRVQRGAGYFRLPA